MPRHEQQERVEVAALLAPHAPVQARRPAGPVTGDDRAQHGSRRDRRPPRDDRGHRFVGGPQAVRVLDRHHAAARQRPGEHHGARGGGEHGGALLRSQIHAAVTRAEAVRRLPERHLHRRDRPQRPGVGGGAPCGGARPGDARWGAVCGGSVRRRRTAGPGPRSGGRTGVQRREHQPEHQPEQPARRQRRDRHPSRPLLSPPPGAFRSSLAHPPTVPPGRPRRKPLPPGCGCGDAVVDNFVPSRDAEAGGHGVRRMLNDAPRQRGDFARPRTRQDSGPRADPAERCPGGPATHGRRHVAGPWPAGPVSGATPGRCRRPARRDNRVRGPAGRAGPRGEHRPWPSSP